MTRLHLLVPARPRAWQRLVVERLDAAGHDLQLDVVESPEPVSPLLSAALRLEASLLRRSNTLFGPTPPIPPRPATESADLTLDLTGYAPGAERVSIIFDGAPDLSGAVATLIDNRTVDIQLVRDGAVLRRARPMRETPASVVLSLDDALSRVVTLVVSLAFDPDRMPDGSTPLPIPSSSAPLLPALLFRAWPRLVGEVVRRRRFRQAHWRVGYRFIDGPGVADTGTLAGPAWSVIEDDGHHFYADPFPITVDGRDLVFVEDYPHATGKAVIAVVEFDDEQHPKPPRVVLEEAHHLSYPQVFARQGGVFMLPEASGGKTLVLYRATAFPDGWLPYVELIAGREISDATLLEHEGHHWLFATERDGRGSTSDTLVVWSAPRLEGPWSPHPKNPILIDCTAARPGGAVVEVDGKLLLPVQNGAAGYGDGLGLSEILRLDETDVVLAPPVPIETAGFWPYPRIHTLNRAGRLEVIDGIAAVPSR